MKTVVLILMFSFFAFGQDTKPAPKLVAPPKTGSNELVITSVIEKTLDAELAEARVNQISNDAGRFFKEGLFNIQDNRRSQAREGFDKAVEVFLMSSVNVNSNQKLSGCYTLLIETVYRVEFPSAQLPPIKSLSATCGWNVDNALADGAVAKLSQKPVQNDAFNIAQGFNEQKFQPALVNDDLALPVQTDEAILGKKPVQEKDGKVSVVMSYFDANFNDPYSMRFIGWSNVTKVYIGSEPFWGIQVRFRAKNAYNAYILSEMIFYIQKNKVVKTKKVF